MDDARVRAFEEYLWTGDPATYRDRIDGECLMIVPQAPYLLRGDEAVAAMSVTPRWSGVDLDDLRIARPEEGMIVVAYHARAAREGGDGYEAWCTSTYRRLGHDDWRVVQHQQTPPLVVPAEA